MLTKYKLFGIIESHHKASEEGSLHIDNYKCFSLCRPRNKNAKTEKVSGGLAVYVHNSIKAGVNRVPLPGTESIIIRLKKEFFGLNVDTFVCFAYCVPPSSKVLNAEFMPSDVFSDLEDKLARCAGEGNILLLGDMNSRTLTQPDYNIDEDTQYVPITQGVYNTNTTATDCRANQDRGGYNSYGVKFLDLCKKVSIRILNGRFFGDLTGKLTCFTGRGSSTVDYAAASPELFSKIRYFSVDPPMPMFSDHCPITTYLRVNAIGTKQTGNYAFLPKPDKLTWDKSKNDMFIKIISSNESQEKISNFFLNGISDNQTSVDTAAQFISQHLLDSSVSAGMLLKKGIQPRKPSYKNRFVKVKPPKWHDKTCHGAFNSLQSTSKLLASDPKNSWLRGKFNNETKQYNKLIKSKHKEYLDSTFFELDKMHSTDPKAYMNLVNALRAGTNDRSQPADTDGIDPEEWFQHFQSLLGKTRNVSSEDEQMAKYIQDNCDNLASLLDEPFTKDDLQKSVNKLKNNKSTSFDNICNEMIKCAFPFMYNAFLLLFNKILNSNLYPLTWKDDILGPLHKSGCKDDPGNFRGISISSCFGKLFSSLLRNRLEAKCLNENLINKCQISGKKGARTSDHLLVFRHLIDKYVKIGKEKLFVCYFDLKKAFDSVNRTQMFYKFLTEYGIGGKFLKIIKNIYQDNNIFIKLSGGLTKPFLSTTGVKQGCVLSPIFFNLFINKLPEIYDNNANSNNYCNPVSMQNKPINCLMWADDCAVFSRSESGLQNSIRQTVNFFSDLGLDVNVKKTKVMIFNPRGLGPNNFKSLKFSANNAPIEICDKYTYLGLVFKPSGSTVQPQKELLSKASKSWFSISSIIYQNKKMPIKQSLQLLDSICMPVGLYASEFLTPLSLPQAALKDKNSILKAWEDYPLETINQRACRTILSVSKKATRLAVLSELGRYPVFLNALIASISYEWHLKHRAPSDSLASLALSEMESWAASGHDCWLARVKSISKLLNIKNLHAQLSPDSVRGQLKKVLRSKFEIFWKDEVTSAKLGAELCFYSQLKSCFKTENYVESVKNRNQRCWISRLRISAHNLALEKLRYRRPPIPPELRFCDYCGGGTQNLPKFQDSETHFLMECKTFEIKRACFIKRLECYVPNINKMSKENQIKTMLCPTSPQAAKLINKFIGIMFKARENIDNGENILSYPTWDPTKPNPFIDHTLDNSTDSEQFSDLSFVSVSSITSDCSN